jgi:hypothetical protein
LICILIFKISHHHILAEKGRLPIIDEPIKRIDTVNELFEYFGYAIEHELDNEISIRRNDSEQILKIPKQIFTDFCLKWSQVDDGDDILGANNTKKKREANNKSAKSMAASNHGRNAIAGSSKCFTFNL